MDVRGVDMDAVQRAAAAFGVSNYQIIAALEQLRMPTTQVLAELCVLGIEDTEAEENAE
jgi:hypothetical protein